ncbi:MAG TPA: FHA domain-containing protein [Pseudonocardia sp.]|nr:FHA domain-containing protein [Pseudonocardia sp.]
MDFDALRAAVVPGAGVVGRWPGVICVAECADRHVLRQLLDVCASAAGGEPGRTLARRLAGWLGGPDAPGDGLRFGTVAVTGGDSRARGEQWAVFLYGPVGLVVPDRQVALSGAQSVAWTDRLLPRPDAPVVLALEGGPIPPGVVDGVHDLRMGVVPAAGAVLVPGGGGTSGELADESGRTRPDDRWPESGGQERPRWDGESLPAPPEPHQGESPGNGLPSRGSFGSIDGFGGYEGGETERPAGPGAGRAHLRPVPSGSNGVAHHGWVPRRGSSLDTGRDPDADPRRAADDDPPESRADRTEARRPLPPEREEPRAPEITSPGIGDEHHDTDHRNGRNGARTNGATYGLLGGPAEALPREPERSPWSDGRDAGRPERIEGWFATRNDAGTESDLGVVGPAELRRRRHGRPEDDAAGDDLAAESDRDAASRTDDDLGLAGEDYGAPTGDHGPSSDHGTGDFGTGSGEDVDTGVEQAGDVYRHPAPEGREREDRDLESGEADGRNLDGRNLDGGEVDGRDLDGGDLDGAGDGTPKLGVPRPVPGAPSEPEPTHQGADVDAPHTTALRSERILGVAPGEPDRPALDDGPATGGLVVDQQVSGYLCARGHLNDPRAQYCALCGAPIEEQAGPAAPGPRPPLGLLVFDDGATYTVDAEYLMGRMPEADPRVTSGSLRSLALEDTSGAVSRVHAQIIVDGWDALLVDAGSRNGTFVSPPGEQGWTQLPAGETHRLVPGTRVRIGGRTFQFESPSGVR